MPDARRALLLLNPKAGRPPNAGRLQQGIGWLEKRGWRIEQPETSDGDEIESRASQAASDGFDAVVVCGGDGTLHEALAGVVGTDTALAILPSGTANVWAGEAKLPHDPIKALRLLEEGDRVRLDTGVADGQPFLLMASIGIDSLVAGRVDSGLKRRLSFLPYLVHAAMELRRFKGMTVEVMLDGELISSPAVGVLIGNTRSYGGMLRIAAHARADDGLLDVCLFHGTGRLRFLWLLALTAAGRHLSDSAVTYRQVNRITVATKPIWPVQLDGEIAAQTPMSFECVPRSVTLIVPRDVRSPLWSPAAER